MLWAHRAAIPKKLFTRPILSRLARMVHSQPEDGSTLTANFKILPSDLASATSPEESDGYAKVLATPRVVAFMEIVCARMLVPHQAPGQMSVGTRVEMNHLAATNVDEMISVTAKFLGKEGKQFAFDTVITDAGGEVGRGKHWRAMIDEQRLMEGARKRMASKSKI